MYAIIETALTYDGVMLGAIPTMLLGLLFVILPAPWLCKKWDARKTQKATESQDTYAKERIEDIPSAADTDDMSSTDEPIVPEKDPPILFCRKCGSKLLPESGFCSKCGTPVVKE